MGGVHLGVKQVLGIWLVAAGACPRLSRLSRRPCDVAVAVGCAGGSLRVAQPGSGKT